MKKRRKRSLKVKTILTEEEVEKITHILLNALESEYNRYLSLMDDNPRAASGAMNNIVKIAAELRGYAKQMLIYSPWKRDMESRILLRESIAEEKYNKIQREEEDKNIELIVKVPSFIDVDIENRLQKKKELEQILKERDEKARKFLNITPPEEGDQGGKGGESA
jgi:diphthamide synthase subunit DPH2